MPISTSGGRYGTLDTGRRQNLIGLEGDETETGVQSIPFTPPVVQMPQYAFLGGPNAPTQIGAGDPDAYNEEVSLNANTTEIMRPSMFMGQDSKFIYDDPYLPGKPPETSLKDYKMTTSQNTGQEPEVAQAVRVAKSITQSIKTEAAEVTTTISALSSLPEESSEPSVADSNTTLKGYLSQLLFLARSRKRPLAYVENENSIELFAGNSRVLLVSDGSSKIQEGQDQITFDNFDDLRSYLTVKL